MMDWLPDAQWIPCTAPFTNGSVERHPDSYLQVVRQFHVTTEKRYLPVGKATFCNVFVADCTRALACEIPHWWMGREFTANDMLHWLGLSGAQHGWLEVLALEAAGNAQRGQPTIVVWENVTGPGHIAMVIPTAAAVPMISQAGATNFDSGTVPQGFGPRAVRFFTHS